jgi:hypothetical protein
MAVFNKFNSFVEAIAEKKHDLGADIIKVALCNAANAPTASKAVLADLTTVSTTNLSPLTPTRVSSSQTGGTYSLVLQDLTMTASGTVDPFRYVVLYNDTATDDDLICWYDYGSDVTLNAGESFTLDFGATVLTLA